MFFKKNEQITICTTNDIFELSTNIRFFRPRLYENISFNLTGLTIQENTKISKHVGRLYFACGCNHGKISIVVALFFSIIYALYEGYQIDNYPYFIAIGVIAFISLFVKITSQVFSKIKLIKLLDNMIEIYK